MSSSASAAGDGCRPVRLSLLTALLTVIVTLSAWGAPTLLIGQTEPAPVGPGTELTTIDRALVEASAHRLLAETPGLRSHRDGLGSTIFYGRPMTEDFDPDVAVDRFWEKGAQALGVLPEELSLDFVAPLSDDRATVYAYRVSPSGIEVEGAVARLLVWHDRESGLSQVTYAAARTALPPVAGYPRILVTAASAAATARLEVPDPGLEWFDPLLVITPGHMAKGEVEIESRLAWHVRSSRVDESGQAAWSVIIDPETGRVLEVRDEILFIDIEGSVEGAVTPAPFSDNGTSPPVVVPLSGATVSTDPTNAVFTEEDGSFVLPFAGSNSVAVESTLDGRWVSIVEQGGIPELSFTDMVLPPGPYSVMYDAGGSEFQQAQINGYYYTDLTHRFIRERTAAGIPGIDIQLPCNVNINDTCNAGYDPFNVTINFFRAGGSCPNTCFSNVISHEYGHFVVSRLGLTQGAFGEGYGDVLAMFLYDDPIIGRDFFGSGTSVRDPLSANVQFPCDPNNSGVHFCGQILGATWWKIRSAFGNQLGSAAGLEAASQLFIDWSLITLGGTTPSGTQESTAIEVLTIDDDDGTLDNGSPNFSAICDVYASHSIDCPPVPVVIYNVVGGIPTQLIPGAPTTVTVEIAASLENPILSTATLHFREEGSTSFTTQILTAVGGGFFEGTILPQTCGASVEFFLSVDTAQGSLALFPEAGAGAPFLVGVFDTVEETFSDRFESDTGWVAGVPGDTAQTGVWTRVDPIGTAAAPENDNSTSGSFCYVTGQGVAGGALGAADVDDGRTTLMSPVLDLSAPGEYFISYARWFSNDASAQPNTEVFTVEISNNNGASWTQVEVVGPTGPETSGGWITREFDVGSIVAPTAQVRVRFVAEDPDPGSLVEAGVDDFRVTRQVCDPAPSFQRGDVNGDGMLSLPDAIETLAVLFLAGNLPLCRDAIDTNDSGLLEISDAIFLLEYLFVSGPAPAAPSGVCGPDPTADSLDCETAPICP